MPKVPIRGYLGPASVSWRAPSGVVRPARRRQLPSEQHPGTLHGLPVGFALAGAKADERQVLPGILADPALTAGRARQIIIGDKNYYGHDFETTLADGRICLLRPPAKANRNAREPSSSSHCARSSNPSTTRSKASSTWNATAATPRPAPWSESCSASSP